MDVDEDEGVDEDEDGMVLQAEQVETEENWSEIQKLNDSGTISTHSKQFSKNKTTNYDSR